MRVVVATKWPKRGPVRAKSGNNQLLPRGYYRMRLPKADRMKWDVVAATRVSNVAVSGEISMEIILPEVAMASIT